MRIGVVCVIKESWGGSEELWAAMAHEALANGHEIIVSAYDCGSIHPKMRALIDKGVKLIYRRGFVKPGLPVWKRILNKASVIALNRISNPFKKFIDNRPENVLYVGAEYSLLEDKPLIYKIKKNKIPFYINIQLASEFRQVVSQSNTEFMSAAYELSSNIFFVSHKNKESLERHFAVKLPKSIVVRNPVNLRNVDLIQYPKTTVIQFALVGNIILAHKGQDILFDILRQPKWLEREWHLNIYGEGMDMQFLKTLSFVFGIESRITFHGRVSDIRAIWSNNNILIMPSIMEGMALAVVEAMLCGRTVVTTDVGGHGDWIKHNEDGFLADGPTIKSFSTVLENAWQRKSEWQELGLRARKKALEMYDHNPGLTLLKLLK